MQTCVAALFALFTLMIIHFKRHKRDCDFGQGHVADGVIPMQAERHEKWQVSNGKTGVEKLLIKLS